VLLVAAALAARPEAAAHVDSADGRFRCHHGDGAAALCDIVLPALDEAWAAQVDGLGFRSPVSDGARGGSDALDVYMLPEGTGGAGGAYVACDGDDLATPEETCTDSTSGDGYASDSAYIVIDPRTDTAALRGYAHHEFNHVLQYATDFEEPFLSVWEGTAVAAEYWTDPGMALDPGPVADYQAVPWASAVLHDGYFLDEKYGLWSYYEYGAMLWVRWLDERHFDGTGAAGPALWDALANDPGDNEPDVLDAWSEIAGDWREDMVDFAISRGRFGTAEGPEWLAELGDGAAISAWEALGNEGTTVTSVDLYPLGAAYFEVTLSDDRQRWLNHDRLEQNFAWAVVSDPGGIAAASDRYASIDVRGPGTVRLALVYLGGQQFDADSGDRDDIVASTVVLNTDTSCSSQFGAFAGLFAAAGLFRWRATRSPARTP